MGIFLEKQIEFKLNNIFFGNKEGTGEGWKNVLLKLPSPSQPSNTAAGKLYKLLLKPTFKGKGVNNWRVDPNISAHPITSPKAPTAGAQVISTNLMLNILFRILFQYQIKV